MKPTSIGAKMRLVGGLLSFIIVLIILLTVSMNDVSKKDSLIINIAGKQRMLSQKMSKDIFFIIHRHSNDFREIDTAVDLFEKNLNDLLFGNETKGIYTPRDESIKVKLSEVMEIWKPFKKEIEALKKDINEVKPEIETLTQKTEKLLSLSDVVVKKMVTEDLRGLYIDFSGRQRMLSQRMGFYIERYLRTDNKQDFLLFFEAKNLYGSTVEDFVTDEELKRYPDVYRSVEEVHAYWEEYQAYLTKLLNIEGDINKRLAYIYEKNVKLLNTMDEAVWLYTDDSERQNNFFVVFQYLSLLVALIIILYSFIVSRDIVAHLDDFIRKTKELSFADVENIKNQNMILHEDHENSEDELKEASSHISKFIKKVNSAMSHSEEAIERAENAISELQQLAEDVEDAISDMDIDESEKNRFDKNVNATEDIAIQSAENLIHVTRMLQKLKKSLNAMEDHKYAPQASEKETQES
ncbi:MAG: type IV pili methyl-accepting chemotaxis transducer N-terminal domain-containing protein [Sulfurospirillaceae bacterium]|nr:type IV pili methyl-accepting chemotaxis transducer N-terminal domain-containing protein [Sulfurospirillaceae bacterium]